MTELYDAFISYGRADSKAFAAQLCQYLTNQGYRIWYDFNDIPLGVDFQNQINDGIEKAHNFLYVIAPHSVNSVYCAKEVERALMRGKRIIPLLHVEHIHRETWQQRYPTGTDAQWADYQAQGLHSSFTNMHPEISKINWVYMREGQDNLSTSVAGLIDIFERHRDHVHSHTRLLVKALEWEQQHRRSSHLLVAEERQQAEDWLLTRFHHEQPPCRPTDLHCEFITESLKNARNLMTQVFLTHADEDKDSVQQMRRSLMRAGLTVWASTSDIQTGADFQTAINQGIEEADNLVYLLSPDSLRSSYCHQELDYALSLNKRVIPVLVKPIDGIPIPDALKTLQYIDLTDNLGAEDYQKDESDLLRILRQDDDYYDNHKQLLVKALKWKQQEGNASILLRGYNLHHGEKWLQLAKQRPQHGPTSLHEEFIEASLRQPPATSLDVFVSYSRADADFARKLNDTLQIQGKTTWFDQESIAAGTSDFQQEIYRGIEVSDNFLFILSPNAVQSPYCNDEVEYAVKLNRRIVTVLYRPVATADLHPELAKVQWLDFSQHNEEFNHQFNRLIRTLETDREHVHSHTKWSQRALEWDQKGREEDLLLRGNELAIAQDWLKRTHEQQKRPDATELQKALIEFSQASVDAAIQREIRQAKRLKRLLVGVSTALVVAVGASIVAFQQSQRAVKSQIDALTQASQASFTLNRNSFEALMQALEAGTLLKKTRWAKNDPVLRTKVMDALTQANYWVKERNRLEGHTDYVQAVSFSPDDTIIATASFDQTVRLWNEDGSLLRTLTGHKDTVNDVSVSPDGTMIATASHDYTVKLWTMDGQEIITLDSHKDLVNGVSFSPDGQTLATASGDTTVKLWTVEGQLLHTFEGHQDGVLDVSFSPDGQTLATTSLDHTVILWNIPQRVRQLTLKEHQDAVSSVDFSPDGQTIATSSRDETIKLWTYDGQLVTTLPGHHGPVTNVAFSPDGRTLVSASDDKTVKRWQLDSPNLIQIERGHDDSVYGVDFSPDGQMIATTSEDGSAKLWTADGQPLQTLTGHLDAVTSVHFSPDSQTIATASRDETVKLWGQDGQEKSSFSGHQDNIVSVRFSPNGELIVTASFDQTAKLWQSDGTLVHTLEGHDDRLYGVGFSPDGQMIATTSADNTIKLWTKDGDELQTLIGHAGQVYQAHFGPDGEVLASVSEDNMGKLWTVDGKEILSLDSHSAGVWAVDVSSSGQMIATGSDDNTVKVWRRDGTLITTLIGHQGPINGVSFSPDGNTLVSVDTDGQMLIWNMQDLTLEGLLEYGCGWVKSYLNTNTNISSSVSSDVCDRTSQSFLIPADHVP